MLAVYFLKYHCGFKSKFRKSKIAIKRFSYRM